MNNEQFEDEKFNNFKNEFIKFFDEVDNEEIKRNNAIDEYNYKLGAEINLPINVEKVIDELDVDIDKKWKVKMITYRLIDNILHGAGLFIQLYINTAMKEFTYYVDENKEKFNIVYKTIVAELPNLISQ